MKETVFTLKLEPDLREQFVAAAQAAHRPASQIVRELMREFIERQSNALEHDAWFCAEVDQSLRDVAAPNAVLVANEDVEADWRRQRATLIGRAGDRPA